MREAFAAGASGYVLKEAADVEVVTAIREVAAGGRYVNPTLGASLVAAAAEAERRAEADPLSDREREVLVLLARGFTNQEIAKHLFISTRTAETHRAHVMQKLRLASRAELVSYASLTVYSRADHPRPSAQSAPGMSGSAEESSGSAGSRVVGGGVRRCHGLLARARPRRPLQGSRGHRPWRHAAA